MAKKKAEFKFKVPGDMTIYEGVANKNLFLGKLKKHDTINVDLSNVSEIDSSGLQLMVSMKNDAIKENKMVNFQAHSQAVIELLDLFGMTSYFGDPIVMKK